MPHGWWKRMCALMVVLGGLAGLAEAHAAQSYAPFYRWTVENRYSQNSPDWHNRMFSSPEASFVGDWHRDSFGGPCVPGMVRRWDYVDWRYTESVPSFPYKNSIAEARYNLVECDGSEVNGPLDYPSASIRHWMCSDGVWREPLIVTDNEVCTLEDDEPEVAANLGPPDCDHQCFGDPIHSATGNKYEARTEYQGGSRFLRFEWTYNARAIAGASTAGSILGRGRSTNLSPSLSHFTRLLVSVGRVGKRSAPTETTVYLTRGNGRSIRFRDVGDTWEPALPDGGRLFRHGGDAWEYQSKDGTSEFFGMNGRLERVQDLSGQSVEIDYDDAGRVILMTDAQGRSLGFIYGPEDRLSSLILPEGGLTKFTYTPTGFLERVTYPDDSYFTYLYDEPTYSAALGKQGLLTGEVDESGSRRSSTWYDASGVAYKTALAGGIDTQSAQFSPSPSAKYHARTVVTGNLGSIRTTDFVVRRGKLLTAKSIESCDDCTADSSTYQYNNLALISSINRNGVVELRQYDAAGNETSRTQNAEGTGNDKRRTETNWAAERSQPLSRTVFDASNVVAHRSSWAYNNRGQLIRYAEHDGSSAVRTTTVQYCESDDIGIAASGCPFIGLPRANDGPREDVQDVTRTFYYTSDDMGCNGGGSCTFRVGDIAKIVNALGHTIEVLAYNPAGRPQQVRDENGVIIEYVYNARGWLTLIRVLGGANGGSPADRTTVFEYSKTGSVKRVTAPDGAYLAYGYDAADRLIEIADNAGNSIQYKLDSAGNRVDEKIVGMDGSPGYGIVRIYNQLGQLITSVGALLKPIQYEYDGDGNITRTRDALGSFSLFEYDGLDRIRKYLADADEIAAETRFDYDAKDGVVSVTDPKGLHTSYAYNGFGDLISQLSPDSGSTAFTVDAAGNRTTQTDARGVTATFHYDALNRLTGIAYPDPNLNIGYSYDTAPAACAADERFAKGHLSAVLHPGGSTGYCHDRFGQVTRKVQTINGATTSLRYAYTKAGRLAALTYPDGSVADYVRDIQGRISQVGLTRPGQARQVVVSQVTHAAFGPPTGWTYGNGRQLQRPLDLDYRPQAVHDPSAGGLSLSYGYDPVGAITELKNGAGTSVLAKYGYDTLGRLTQTKDGATDVAIETYAYDATGNRTALTTAAGTVSYTYPVDSHRLLAVDGETRSHDAVGNTTSIGGKELSYSDANRMNGVKQAGAVVESYTYNHRGERVLRVPASGGALITVYDEAGQWIGNYGAAGHPLQQAIWFDNYPIALINAPSAGVPEVAYVQPDHLGTPRVVIDPIRDVAIWEWSSKGEAFGNQLPNMDADGDGAAFEVALRFPGQQATDASGMFYNYQRDYDPAVGRYSQSDPIGLSGGISTYGYVEGRPLTRLDMKGLESGMFQFGRYRMKQPEPVSAEGLGDAIAAGKMLAGYNAEMKSRMIIGSDQFYHCMAACRATQATGDAALVIEMMALKETKDYYAGRVGMYGDRKMRSHAEMRADNAGDMSANRYGAQCEPGESCARRCSSYVPATSRPYLGDYIPEWKSVEN